MGDKAYKQAANVIQMLFNHQVPVTLGKESFGSTNLWYLIPAPHGAGQWQDRPAPVKLKFAVDITCQELIRGTTSLTDTLTIPLRR